VERARVAKLRAELGDGEGVSLLLSASLRDSDSRSPADCPVNLTVH